jgi:hypothetical protein
MTWCREPTLHEILSDPIVAAMMQADAVDDHALDEMLNEIGERLRADVRGEAARARR